MNYNCKCCGKEISERQWQFCNLCGLCDTGKCHNPKAFHELQEKYFKLLEERRKSE